MYISSSTIYTVDNLCGTLPNYHINHIVGLYLGIAFEMSCHCLCLFLDWDGYLFPVWSMKSHFIYSTKHLYDGYCYYLPQLAAVLQ